MSNDELRNAILAESKRIGADPLDFAQAMSYETGGTFDPWKRGPTTQWGQHIGYIQMGVPQRQKYGYTEGKSITELVRASADYLVDRGFKPGMSGLDLYSTINAGSPGRYTASDENNGGAKGDVRYKWENMGDHRRKAAALLGGSYAEVQSSEAEPFNADMSAYGATSTSTPIPIQPYVAKDEQPDAASLWQVAEDSFLSNQSAAWASRDYLNGPGDYADPNFKLDQSRLDQDFSSKGIDVSIYADKLGEVTSEARYGYIRDLIYEDQERQTRLGKAGLTGTVLNVANSMLDLGTLPADIVIGSVAPELVLAKKAPRIHRALVGAMAGSAAGTVTAGAGAAVNPHMDGNDVLYGAVLGFGFGGLAGSLMSRPELGDVGADVQAAARKLAQDLEAGDGAPGSVGAASLGMRPNENFLNDARFDKIQDEEVAKTAFAGKRYSLGGILHGSKNPLTRLGAYLVQDGVGKVGENVNGIAVTEELSRLSGGFMRDYHRSYEPLLEEFRKSNNFGYFERDAAAQQFNEQITAYIRDRSFDNRDARHAAEVVKMGKKLIAINEEIRQMAANPFIREGLSGRAVAGFEKIAKDPHYIMRQWDAKKVADARQRYGEGVIDQLIEGAMTKANYGVPASAIQKAARAFSKAIVRNAFGVEDMMLRNISRESADDLIETLAMHGDMTREDAADLINRIVEKADDAGNDSRAKHRTIMAEDFELKNFRTKDGTTVESLKLADLLNNDATHLTTAYVRRMSGLIALSRFRIRDPKTGELILDGITKDSEFEQFLRIVDRKAADLEGAGKLSAKQREYDAKGLRFAYDMIRGRPPEAGTFTDDLLRTMREINYARVMNQAGFAQLPEFGNVIGNLGFRAAFSHMPALRRIVDKETGETMRRSGFADDMELFSPYGIENLTHNTSMRFDDLSGRVNSLDRGTRLQKVEGVARKVNRVSSLASGMAHVNEALQTMVSQGIVQKFAIMAHGKGFSAARLADMGLTPEMGQRIYAQFRKEGNFDYTKGLLTGKKIVRAHFDKWDDLEAREALRNAVWRFSTNVVQKNDLGNIPMWMNRSVGKTFTQFRTFVIAAYEKQMLHSLHMRDFPALMAGLLATTFAGITYVVQEKIRNIGKHDDKFLEDRLSWTNIGLAAVSRAGWASIAPMVMDTGVSQAVFGRPLFDFRTTGQGQSAILGNPTAGFLLDDLPASVGALSQPLMNGREMSQQEARALGRMSGFSNFLPTSWLFNSMIRDLPRRAPKDEAWF